MPDPLPAPTLHAWRRKSTARARWLRVASGTAAECATADAEFARKNPEFCDSYTGVNDPNIPTLLRRPRAKR